MSAARCNRCHRPMEGTTAYDGACECGGLIERAPRVNWLCGCGDGRLGVPEADVPTQCPTCGCPIPGTGEEEGE